MRRVTANPPKTLMLASRIATKDRTVIAVSPTVAHGFRFTPQVTDGWVVSFTEDVAAALGERSGEALKRLKALAAEPVIPLVHAPDDPGLDSGLDRDPVPETSTAPASDAWHRLRQLFRFRHVNDPPGHSLLHRFVRPRFLGRNNRNSMGHGL